MKHYASLPQWEVITRSKKELDLRDAHATDAFFAKEKPEYVILAAAKVGGIKASYTQPVDFLLDNLQIQNAVLSAAHRFEVKKLLFLGSTCIYPKTAEMPIREDSLLTGPMEETNAPYGVAKIAGIKLCQGYRHQHGRDFICGMPANLYGPFDNFDPEHSHVLPSLIRRFHEAAETIKGIIGYAGEIRWDTTQPDGNPRRLLDVTRLAAQGWEAKTAFRDGVARTYAWFLENRATARV